MKKNIYSFSYFVILIIINIFISRIFGVDFLEMSFLIGIVSSVIIGFFSNEGGFSTTLLDSEVKYLTQSKSRTHSYFTKFYTNIPFIVSIIYTILSAMISVIVYRKYF